MDSEYALVRGKSKKEIKNEQTKDLYKDITSALHEKVGEFMAEVTVSEDGDSEIFREDTEKNIRELKCNLNDEVHERISGDRQLMEQCEKLNMAMSRGHNDLKYLLEQESRERMSLQKQVERDLAQISEALAVSQRMQPRGFDELREMIMRLEENCKENSKRMNVSIREDVRRMLQEDARTRSFSDQRLNDVHRSVKELEQLQRMQPRGFDELRDMIMRLEENCKENSKRMDVSIREDVRRTLQEDASTRSFSNQRLDDLYRSVKELEQVHERIVNDVRSAVQEQAKVQALSERHFDESDQLSHTMAQQQGFTSTRLEERCDRLEAALDSIKSLPRDAVPCGVCEQLRESLIRLEDRCNTMDFSMMQQRAAMSEPAEETRRQVQEELRRLKNAERCMDDKLEKGLTALTMAQPTEAVKTRTPTQTSRPGEMACGWQREERQFAPSVALSPTSFREMSPQQMSPQQTTSPQAPPKGRSRGWSREEVRRPIYAVGL